MGKGFQGDGHKIYLVKWLLVVGFTIRLFYTWSNGNYF